MVLSDPIGPRPSICKMIMCLMFIVSPDVLSITGFEGASRSSTASLRDSIHGESLLTTQRASSIDQIQRPSNILPENFGAQG